MQALFGLLLYTLDRTTQALYKYVVTGVTRYQVRDTLYGYNALLRDTPGPNKNLYKTQKYGEVKGVPYCNNWAPRGQTSLPLRHAISVSLPHAKQCECQVANFDGDERARTPFNFESIAPCVRRTRAPSRSLRSRQKKKKMVLYLPPTHTCTTEYERCNAPSYHNIYTSTSHQRILCAS